MFALFVIVASLQAASLGDRVAAAAPGDTVRVPAGVYVEPTVVVDRPLVLIGEAGTVLDGQGKRALLEIRADNVTVEGFTFRHTGVTFLEDRAALRVQDASQCRIAGNRFEETFFGVYLARADRCEIARNEFRTTPDREVNGGNAIHSWYSTGLRITDNSVSGHRDGIYLEFTSDSRVVGNASSYNLRYGLHFMFSDRCSYERNTFEGNGAGVAVMYAEGVTMTGNRFAGAAGPSAYGLLLKEIKGGTLAGNTFEANAVALHVESTDRMLVEGNHFVRNGWAVRVMADATDNRFVRNAFNRNTFDVSTNSRHTAASTFAENYWDRYDGYDLDRDGFGDRPFRPVRLFALIVELHEPAVVLLGSPLAGLLDAMESVVPLLTPESLIDPRPAMKPLVP